MQYDTPSELLAAPRDDFVKAFVGADLALKRLSLLIARAFMQPATADATALPGVDADASLRDALAHMLAKGVQKLRITGDGSATLGTLSIESIMAASQSPVLHQENHASRAWTTRPQAR